MLYMILGVVLPARARLDSLLAGEQARNGELAAKRRENARLAAGLARLTMGDGEVWEAQIRARLGWMKRGEVPLAAGEDRPVRTGSGG